MHVSFRIAINVIYKQNKYFGPFVQILVKTIEIIISLTVVELSLIYYMNLQGGVLENHSRISWRIIFLLLSRRSLDEPI